MCDYTVDLDLYCIRLTLCLTAYAFLALHSFVSTTLDLFPNKESCQQNYNVVGCAS